MGIGNERITTGAIYTNYKSELDRLKATRAVLEKSMAKIGDLIQEDKATEQDKIQLHGLHEKAQKIEEAISLVRAQISGLL